MPSCTGFGYYSKNSLVPGTPDQGNGKSTIRQGIRQNCRTGGNLDWWKTAPKAKAPEPNCVNTLLKM